MRRFNPWRSIAIALASLIIAISTASSIGAAPAVADDGCDAMIVDQTNGRVLGDQSRITQTASSQLSGYTVRIRAFETAPYGSLDTYFDRMLSSCTSWQNAEQSGTIIVIAFSVDRKSLTHLSSVSKSRNDNVRAAMTPYFKSGDFQGGISAALTKAATYMKSSGDTLTNSAPHKPTNWAAVGIWVGIVFGAAAVIIALILLVRWSRRRQRDLAEAKRKLNSARSSATISRNLLDNFVTVDQEIQTLRGSVTASVFGRLDRTVSSFTAKRDQIGTTFDDLERQYKKVGDNLGAIKSLTSDYETLKGDADEASHTLNILSDQVADIQSTIENGPAQLKTLKSRLAALRSRCEDLQMQGFVTVDASNAADQVDSLLAEAEKFINDNRSGQAIELLEQADEILGVNTNKVNEAPRQHQELTSRHQQLSDQAGAASADVEEAASILDEISRDHGGANMGQLATAGELSDNLATALASIASASGVLEPKNMPWSKAESALDSAQTMLQGLTKDVAKIRKHKGKLDEIARTLPAQVAQLIEDVNACKANINDRDGNQDQHLRAIKALIKKINKLDGMRDLIAAEREYTKLSAELEEINAAGKKTDRKAHQRSSSSYGHNSGYGGGYGSNNNDFITGVAVGSALNNDHHHSDPTPDPWPSSSGSSSGGWDSGSSSSSTSSGGWDFGGGSSDSSTSSGGW